MSKEEIFKIILSYFKVEKVINGVAHCYCPGHSDNKPSLHISIGDIKILLDCKANCDYKTVLDAVGLKPEQLYYDFYNKENEQKRRISKSQYYYRKNCEAEYIYRRIDNGQHTHYKYKMPGKIFRQGYDKNGTWINTLKDIDISLSIFCNDSIEKLKRTAEERGIIGYFEGGKDCVNGRKYGLIGFTCGSSNDWKNRKKVFEYVKNAQLIIFADDDVDGGGLKSANELKQYFNSLGGGKAIVIVPTEGMGIKGGDFTNYMESHTKEDLYKLIGDAINKSAVKETVREGVAKRDTAITPQGQQDSHLEQALRDLHAERYETSDKGYGKLFADVFKDKHRYNPSRGDFMRYDGKRWVDDVEGLSAKASAKALSDALVRYAINVDTEGKYLKAVTILCNIRNRNNMLQDSKDVYFFSNEQLDVNDYLLNVQNGTLDLSKDNPKFMQHSPDMLLSKICNAEYNPAADCREWKKFLVEIMQDDKEKILYLQKIAGLSLTGNTEQETAFILYGSTTRNGKSTFCETLIHLLGDYALTMKPESLAIKQNLDSRQASGDIARLAGCRFCNASEPPKRMLFDTALLKSLLGRDSITARHLHQREFSFVPKFKLLINTNYLPTITDDTVFSSGRINVISFDRHFEPQEQDKDLKNRLRDKQELSGILNWCIEGLQLYRQQGLEPPQAVQTATNTYRTDSDKIGNFINECLIKTGRNSKAKDIYEAYTKWCEDNGYGCENKGNFFAELKTKGLFMNSGTVEGKTVRNIVKGYTVETDFVKYEGKEPLPFD
ncbi:MAG: phage/plasmid primase, P4 family [Bacteroidales bacterium]|nr:phage/plasmid primase, P4 family [Lachnoclostridium sp.]MCM1384496.1 phage/plasmid primase, P4 family [Lachnoclostridium sp.]MCM1464040.1 phage/plasmid primase, P4 family [Bacteroidales bacterium]